jgi:hypothetical protein
VVRAGQPLHSRRSPLPRTVAALVASAAPSSCSSPFRVRVRVRARVRVRVRVGVKLVLLLALHSTRADNGRRVSGAGSRGLLHRKLQRRAQVGRGHCTHDSRAQVRAGREGRREGRSEGALRGGVAGGRLRAVTGKGHAAQVAQRRAAGGSGGGWVVRCECAYESAQAMLLYVGIPLLSLPSIVLTRCTLARQRG